MHAPEAARRLLIPVYNRWLDFKSSHERSVKVVARRNDSRAFDEIFGSEDLLEEYLAPARFGFYNEIAGICASLRPRTIVDVGCGPGQLLAAVERSCKGVELLVGVDYSHAAIERLQEVVPNAIGIVSSIYDGELPAEQFDLVLCTEVLEHLADPESALLVLRSLCRPGGHLLITVPDGEHDDYDGHVNFWSEQGFDRLLTVTRTREGELVALVAV
jgi:2-polyprenyl-3-methyl-5-hydroxy-6-metoxy-1,4-benzoquinol methylase